MLKNCLVINMDYVIFIDKKITFLLQKIIPHNHFFDYFFSFFSLKGNSIFIWLIIIIVSVFFEEKKNPGISKKDKKFIILFLTAFLLTALIVELPLKNFFHRLRPASTNFKQFQIISDGFNCPKDFSFPSGHAATAFASATILVFFDKKRKWFYYLIAGLISYSRIYLNCHYFADVLIGAIIGIIISKLIIKLLNNK